MPTTPPADLLDRELSRENTKSVNAVAVPLLQEVVNYGLAALARCLPYIRDEDYGFAILLPYKNVLEMVDAVEVLLPTGATAPSRLQLRTAFENLLTIKYIVQTNTKSRAYNFLAAQAQAEIFKLWKVASKHPDLAPPESLVENLTILQRRLLRPGWRKANDRLLEAAGRRFEKKGRFVLPAWYSVGGGPDSLADLATRLGKAKDYDVLYRQWSGVVHGADFEEQLKAGRGQTLAVRRLRLPIDFGNVVTFAVDFAFEATRDVLGFYRPEETRALFEWYVKEVRDDLHKF